MGYPAALPPLKAPSKIIGSDYTPNSGMFPGLMSVKHNGMRGNATIEEDGTPIWRSWNQEPVHMAPHIKEMFSDVLMHSKDHEMVKDGEFASPSLNKVGKVMSVLAGTAPCPDDFEFKCFYELPYSVWNTVAKVPMGDLIATPRHYLPNYHAVEQIPVASYKEFMVWVEENRNNGLEGWMLLNPRAYWRHNRATIAEGILGKYKYYSDPIDARIVDILPRKETRKGLQRKLNPAGYSKRIHGKEFKEDTEIGGKICCILENGDPVIVPFPVGVSFPQRAMYLASLGKGGEYDLKGKWLQFTKLACEDGVGAVSIKDVEFRDGK